MVEGVAQVVPEVLALPGAHLQSTLAPHPGQAHSNIRTVYSVEPSWGFKSSKPQWGLYQEVGFLTYKRSGLPSCPGKRRRPAGVLGVVLSFKGTVPLISENLFTPPLGTAAIIAADKNSEDSGVDEVLSKLQKILKKKKNGSRGIQKKERKEKESVCYECRKPGHLRPDYPKLKKTGQPEKSKKKHKKFKRKAMAAAWENEEATSSESSSSES
ncbi:hypothetical protein Taro_041103 [Colocasia esculenta]|uniref:CCHC-type domain-containing protein n=1 Tax=Colocasia esculenta TaxID=4460 RepID=A0A843WEX7_COLES|nr:hypothetical protein [Colocasia esculenta]